MISYECVLIVLYLIFGKDSEVELKIKILARMIILKKNLCMMQMLTIIKKIIFQNI